MQNNNNTLAEVGIIVLSVLLVVGACLLLVLAKVDYTEFVALIGMALALWGANSLYKAPSPAQQQQLTAQQQSVQQALAQVISVLPAVIGAPAQQPPTQAPAAQAPAPQQFQSPTPWQQQPQGTFPLPVVPKQ